MVLTDAAARTEIATIFQRVIASTPPGANTVTIFRGALHHLVHPSFHDSFKYQLYALSAVMAVTTLLMLTAMLVKWRRGQLWLFRIVRISNVSCIVPHYSMTWALFMAVCTALLQGFIWNNVHFIEDKGPVWDFALWKTLVWYPGWLAFWLSTWSMAMSHVLFVDGSKPGRRSVFLSPYFLNALGVGMPIIIFALVVALGVVGSDHYKKALRTYYAIDGQLAQIEPAFAGEFPAAALQQGVVAGTQMLVDFDYFKEYFMGVFIVFSIGSLAVIVVFLAYSTIHLRALSAAVREVAGPTPTAHETAVRDRYNSILRISAGFLFISVCLMGICLYIAGDTRNIILDPAASSAAILAGLYLLSVIGLPIAILLCVTALDQNAVDVLASGDDGAHSGHAHGGGGGGGSVKDWSSPPVVEAYQMRYPAPTAMTNTTQSRHHNPTTSTTQSDHSSHNGLLHHAGEVQQSSSPPVPYQSYSPSSDRDGSSSVGAKSGARRGDYA